MPSFLELIDYDGNFKNSALSFLNEDDFTSRGFRYSVITILGCQSSGKSTLLNALFGTDFPVMNALNGRSQTTKGIWISKEKDLSTLILDVEGTDSRERGEDRLTFEYRTALFCLALADCVLVNMWYHDLGRYTASNYGLLKTVLGVNLELFQNQENSPKTTMIFVIRDYNAKLTPLETLNAMIKEDIRRLWNETSKPEAYADSVADNFFNFEIIGLPSYVEHSDKFALAWVHEWRPKAYSREIPSDGFALYIETVWNTILKASELDIPSQKEMLATYRCDELKTEAISLVTPHIDKLLQDAEDQGQSCSISERVLHVIQLALEVFDPSASRYHNKVYKHKRLQLIESVQNSLQKVADIYLTQLRYTISEFSAQALNSLCNDVTSTSEFRSVCVRLSDVIKEWKEERMEEFFNGTNGINISTSDEDLQEHFHFNVSYHEEALKESLDNISSRFYDTMVHRIEQEMSEQASDTFRNLDTLLDRADLTSETFWEHVSQKVKLSLTTIQGDFTQLFDGLQDVKPKGEGIEQESFILRIVIQELQKKLKAILEWLPQYIFNRFLLHFNQDEQGVPRQWQHLSSDKIKDIYITARESAFVLPTLFTSMDIGDVLPNFKNAELDFKKNIELPPSKRDEILAKVQMQMQTTYREVLLFQSSSSQRTHVPFWVWILILTLGYNEITSLLSSPLLLLLVIVLGFLCTAAFYARSLLLPKYVLSNVKDTLALNFGSILSSLDSPSPSMPSVVQGESSLTT